MHMHVICHHFTSRRFGLLHFLLRSFYDRSENKKYKLQALDFFKAFAVSPDELPDTIFASIGRTIWRDIGATAIMFRMMSKVRGLAGVVSGVCRACCRPSCPFVIPHAVPRCGAWLVCCPAIIGRLWGFLAFLVRCRRCTWRPR